MREARTWLQACMYDYADASDNRDRLNSRRHGLVQAAVTTERCHHTCRLRQRKRAGNQTSHLGSGTTNPRNQSDRDISP